METAIGAALALVLGILLGTGFGAARAVRLMQQRRESQVLFGRIWPEALPERSAADIIAGRIRVVLGNVPYDLPVLPRGASKRWLDELDTSYRALGSALDAAGDDTPTLIAAVYAQQQSLLDMLVSYDATHALPERSWIDEYATDAEIFRAVVEVWRAANPLADILAGTARTTDGTSPEQPSSPPAPMDGTPSTSMAS